MSEAQNYKLFVGNVPFKCELNEFRDVFKNEEGFIKAELINRVKSKLTRGFGFVEFNESVDLDSILSKEFKLDSRTLRVTQYSAEHDDDKNNKVFIKGLGSTSEEVLKKSLSNFKSVESVELLTDKDSGLSRGMAIVRFNDQDELDTLLNEGTLNVNGNEVMVYQYKTKLRNKSPKKKFVDSKSAYRQGFNNGTASGFSNGFYLGYEKGYEDCMSGRDRNAKKSYLKNSNNHVIDIL